MKLALDGIMREMSGPMNEVERELRAMFADASGEAQEVALHLVEGGGKRVRPLMTLLGARLFSEDAGPAVPIAVAAEMIHMATLVHDDVIDKAETRRGRETVNARWSDHTAVLAGDALLARALVLLVDRTTPEVVRIMSDMVYRMCEGEIAQQNSMFDIDQSEETYLQRIEKKTALFFAACCQTGGLIQGASPSEANALELRPQYRDGIPNRRRYARHHCCRGSIGQAGWIRFGLGRADVARDLLDFAKRSS